MKPKFYITSATVFIIAVLPVIYLAYIYAQLPATVATHFGIDLKPDAYSSKSSLWIIASILAGMSILLYLLMRFLPSIDPKKKVKYSAAVFNKIGVAIVLLFCLLNFLVINAAQKGSFNFGNIIPVAVGIFFAFLGNIMHSIKPNYFAGIRTPWTLESEETWRKTHQMAGRLWFFGGILTAIAGLFLPAVAGTFFLVAVSIVLAVIPIIYSYKYYKSIQKK